MSAAWTSDPSPLGVGLMHFGLSVVAFGGAFAAAAGGVAVLGDSAAAGPVVEVALFEPLKGPPPALKTRIENRLSADFDPALGGEPSLGVEYGVEGGVGEAGTGTVTITELTSHNDLAASAAPSALEKAPIAGYFEKTPAGDLPRIGADGRTPAEVYARPFAGAVGSPKISIVVSGLGLKDEHTRSAVYDLPPEVTLSFVPYANNLQTWINKARAAGHEVVLELPMEAYDYPNVDTGPHTLLTTASPEENVRRLNVLLGKATGYFGVINYQGAKFASDAKAAGPVFAALKSRGIAVLQDGTATRSTLPEAAKAANLTLTIADRVVDFEPSADSIDRELLQLEALALENGSALGVGYAYPVTIEQLRIWTQGLQAKGYKLAPASSKALGYRTKTTVSEH